MSPLDWSKESTIKFIKELESKRSLWDMNCSAYDDKDKRMIDYQALSMTFNISINKIKKKIKTLKGQFYRDFQKYKSLPPNNHSWYGYPLLLFLLDGEKERKQVKRSKTEENDNLDESDTIQTRASKSIDKQLQHKERLEGQSERPMENKKNKLNEEFDNTLIFGEYIGHELRKISNPYLLAVTKHKIQECLYEAQMSMFSSEQDAYLDLNICQGKEASSTTPAYLL